MKKEKEQSKPFIPRKFTSEDYKPNFGQNLDELYKSAHSELSLQQSKRDQIITIYLAIFSFLIPFALSIDALNWQAKGLILLAVGVVGVLFTVIVVRYRVYKDIYWMCCETISCLNNFEADKIDKSVVQSMFYRTLKKKGGKYLGVKNGKTVWKSGKYIKDNIFSSETLHYIILNLVSSITVSLSVFLIVPLSVEQCIGIAIPVAFAVFMPLMYLYFKQCMRVFAVLADNTDASFNRTFGKAWFLHIYLDPEEDEV